MRIAKMHIKSEQLKWFWLCFRDCTLATAGGVDFEINYDVGQTSTFLRLKAGKDGALVSCSYKMDEKKTNKTLVKKCFFWQSDQWGEKWKFFGQKPLELVLDFVKRSKLFRKDKASV